MSIISIGSDLARIDRLGEVIDRRGSTLLDRLFTEGEQAYCEERRQRLTHYAARFAVKEAVMKVLGTGWTNGVRWVDIEVVRDAAGAPGVELHGRSAEIAKEKGIEKLFVSITHDAGLAMAVVVAEG
jgi:holo-[acyl-carrier protein] synthase